MKIRIAAACLLGAIVVAIFLFISNLSGDKYEYYSRINEASCSTEFEKHPFFTMKFDFRKETNEIFLTLESKATGEKKVQSIKKLSPCQILDSKNWTCGGEFVGPFVAPKYTFVDGHFSYVDSYAPPNTPCPTKIVKN